MSQPTFVDQPPSTGGKRPAVITHRDALLLNNNAHTRRTSVRIQVHQIDRQRESRPTRFTRAQSGNGVTPLIYE